MSEELYHEYKKYLILKDWAITFKSIKDLFLSSKDQEKMMFFFDFSDLYPYLFGESAIKRKELSHKSNNIDGALHETRGEYENAIMLVHSLSQISEPLMIGSNCQVNCSVSPYTVSEMCKYFYRKSELQPKAEKRIEELKNYKNLPLAEGLFEQIKRLLVGPTWSDEENQKILEYAKYADRTLRDFIELRENFPKMVSEPLSRFNNLFKESYLFTPFSQALGQYEHFLEHFNYNTSVGERAKEALMAYEDRSKKEESNAYDAGNINFVSELSRIVTPINACFVTRGYVLGAGERIARENKQNDFHHMCCKVASVVGLKQIILKHGSKLDNCFDECTNMINSLSSTIDMSDFHQPHRQKSITIDDIEQTIFRNSDWGKFVVGFNRLENKIRELIFPSDASEIPPALLYLPDIESKSDRHQDRPKNIKENMNHIKEETLKYIYNPMELSSYSGISDPFLQKELDIIEKWLKSSGQK